MASFFQHFIERLCWLDDMLHFDNPSLVLWAEEDETGGGRYDGCHMSPAVYYHSIDELEDEDGDIEFESSEVAALSAGGFFVIWRRKLRQFLEHTRGCLTEERQRNRALWALAICPVWEKAQRYQADEAQAKRIDRNELRLSPVELARCARGLGRFSPDGIQQCMVCLFNRLWNKFRVKYIKPSGDGLAADLGRFATYAKWCCWGEVEAGVVIEMMLAVDSAGTDSAKLTPAAAQFLISSHCLLQEKLLI